MLHRLEGGPLILAGNTDCLFRLDRNLDQLYSDGQFGATGAAENRASGDAAQHAGLPDLGVPDNDDCWQLGANQRQTVFWP